jgi:glycosyltransferase involved in cell wall biosynthesis
VTTILQTTHQGGPAGSTQSIFNLSQTLARRGHRVLVACRADTLLERLVLDAGEPGLERVRMVYEPSAVLEGGLEDVIAREGVEVVNSHATRDRRALTWMRLRGRLPQAFVVTRRTMPLTWIPEIVTVGLAADRTIAVSHPVARELVRRLQPPARIRVVPNGILLERIDAISDSDVASAREALGPLEGRPVVTVLARMKDQHVLLEALSLLERPIVLAFVGIESNERLRALTATTPSRHRVVFVPFVRNGLAFYRITTIAALPSRIEGLSQAILEAMAMEVPVIASDSGGNRDLVRDGETGLLVPPLDARAWAVALEQLLGDRERSARLARAGCDMVRSQYTLAHTAERTEVVYQEALARRRHGPARRPAPAGRTA